MANASVLIIETDAAYVELLEATFQQRGFIVHIAREGHAGLQLANQIRPKLIVLAVELPTINGYIVCKSFKKNKTFSKTPLFLISGEATPRDFKLHQRLRIRADEYFLKPFTQDDIWNASQKYVSAQPAIEAPSFKKGQNLLNLDSSLDEQLDMALDGIFNTSFAHEDAMEIDFSEDEDDVDLFVSVDASVDESHNSTPPPAPTLPANSHDALEALEIEIEDDFEDVTDLDALDGLEDMEDMEDLELLDYSTEELELLRSEVGRLTQELAQRETALRELREGRTKPPEEITKLQDKVSSRDMQIVKLNHELKIAHEERDKAQSNAGDSEGEAAQAASEDPSELETLRHELESAKTQAADLQSQLDEARTQLNSNTEVQDADHAQNDDFALKLTASNAELEQAKTRSEELQAELETQRQHWEQELKQMAEERTRLSDLIRELEDKADNQTKELEEFQLRLAELETENTQLKSDLDETRQNQDSQQETLSKLEDADKAAAVTITTLQAQHDALEVKLSETHQSLEASQASCSALDARLTEAQASHGRDVMALRATLQSTRNSHTIALENLAQISEYNGALELRLEQARDTVQKFSDTLLGLAEQVDNESPKSPEAPILHILPELEHEPELELGSVQEDAPVAEEASDDAAEDEDTAMVVDDFDIVSEEDDAHLPPVAPESQEDDAADDDELEEVVIDDDAILEAVSAALEDGNMDVSDSMELSSSDIEELEDVEDEVLEQVGDDALQDVPSISSLPSLEEVAELDISDEQHIDVLPENIEDGEHAQA